MLLWYLTAFILLILLRDGLLVKCEVYGEVQVTCHLSGVPDLTLSFANAAILNDFRFHPCVRFRPWESHQILSFVPPDGQFKLMSYRWAEDTWLTILTCFGSVFSNVQFNTASLHITFYYRVKKLKNTPIYVKPQFSSDSGACRVSVMVGIRHDPGETIDSITVQFQLPPCVTSSDLTTNHGTVDILANKVTVLVLLFFFPFAIWFVFLSTSINIIFSKDGWHFVLTDHLLAFCEKNPDVFLVHWSDTKGQSPLFDGNTKARNEPWETWCIPHVTSTVPNHGYCSFWSQNRQAWSFECSQSPVQGFQSSDSSRGVWN